VTGFERAALYALLAVNAFAFLAFGLDKWNSRRNARRIPESTLLALTAAGGALGAWAGMRAFRHKTVKTSFRLRFYGAALLCGVWMGVVAWYWATAAGD
jgi:uncharacterized membrane protein YsdA (DUF1294 family)